MWVFCNHKLGKVEGNYQYCIKCGKAFPAPKVGCNHKWIQKGTQDIGTIFGNVYKRVIVKECIHCGEIKQIEIK
jgi:hypothetical protein